MPKPNSYVTVMLWPAHPSILQCCACFGPDSKQDYCAPKCQPINGGTILKEKDNIKVWFWIRSSLPKRVWKQCMEFKEKNNAGKLELWHVEDGVKRKVNGFPLKIRKIRLAYQTSVYKRVTHLLVYRVHVQFMKMSRLMMGCVSTIILFTLYHANMLCTSLVLQVAVVANNQSMNKLPKIEGLLSYRSDDKKLYLNEKTQWEPLVNQNEVL